MRRLTSLVLIKVLDSGDSHERIHMTESAAARRTPNSVETPKKRRPETAR
jgi:hypothetical protein